MFQILSKLYSLVAPFGRRKLLAVAALVVLQSAVQTLGVVGIFPFLALAADPSAARQSSAIKLLLSGFPGTSDSDILFVAGFSAIFILTCNSIFSLLYTYRSNIYLSQLGRWLRVNLLRQIVAREYSYFLSSSTGVVIKKVNGDTQMVVGSVLASILSVVSSALTIILIVVTISLIDPVITLIAGSSIMTCYGAAFLVFASWRDRFSKTMKESSREANRCLYKVLSAIKVIKLQGIEQVFLREFDSQVDEAAKCLPKQRVVTAFPRCLIEPLAMSVLIAIVLVAAYQGQGAASVLPTVGVFALAAYRLLPCVQGLYSGLTALSSNRHCLDEILEEVNPEANFFGNTAQPSDEIGRLALQERLDVKALGFSYPDSRKSVFEDLSFSVPSKTSTAIIGSTGCGKSTLVDTLIGLLKPTHGYVLVDGVDIHGDKVRSWQQSIGYVPQEIILVDGTIEENIALGVARNDVDRNAMISACNSAQILEFIETELPDSWRTQIGERGVRLSGGQRQRIGIARALYRKPNLLVLDEATSALDVETEKRLVDCIRSLDGQMTMIIIAHRLSTIKWCDQVIDLSKPLATRVTLKANL